MWACISSPPLSQLLWHRHCDHHRARGLFSRELPDAGEEEGKVEGPSKKKHQIIVRGYDKFINIGEVP